MPFHIDTVRVPGAKGRIGVCACPGGGTFYGGAGASLADDLDAIRRWGAAGVLTLIEEEEIKILGITAIGNECLRRDMWWLHLPVQDMCAPDEIFDLGWRTQGPKLRAHLVADESFVVHCWAGLGRAGTIAARVLTDFGVPPDRAIALVRDARPGAIQSLQQEIYLKRRGV